MILVLVGCNESEDDPPSVDNITTSPELVEELRKQPTINAQFGVLYDNFGHLLDRSDSLTGLDENNNGIRDDIDAFINLLEISEPVRNALKQNARNYQENLYYDFSDRTDENYSKAYDISKKHLKVIACSGFVGIPVQDSTNIGKTFTALTYNTKARTLGYLAYNRILDGSTWTLLPDEEQYCE